MGGRFSDLLSGLYDSKKRQFLGRDGAAWLKLGVFYFFFYLGLAGFFCAMLAVFMAVSPRDRPTYWSHSSSMRTRSNPLAPGLGFRPQPEPEKNLIFVDKNAAKNTINPFAKSLDQYLQIFYWKGGKSKDENFVITEAGECTNSSKYGYSNGKPCVLVKMNKIVGFVPEPGASADDKENKRDVCDHKSFGIGIHCQGEYPADVDNIGPITYFDEDATKNKKCGYLNTKWFPYSGKTDRQDTYQAPYIWVQFTKPRPNVLINVLCRAYGKNIEYDKKTGRALTRFQIYVQDETASQSSRKSGDI